MRVKGIGFLLVGVLTLTACGNSAVKVTAVQPLPKEWSSAGKKEVKDLATKLRGKDSAECNKIGFINPQGLQASYARYKWRIAARAVGNCEAFNNVLEISVFASSADREEFVNERTNGLCRRGFAVDAPLPAFQWATGAEWAVQGDSRGGVVKAAKRLDGIADTRTCSKKITLGWTRPGIATVRRVSALITGANVECLGFALLERADVIQGDPVGKAPAALGACLDAAKRPMLIGAFGPITPLAPTRPHR